jgi:uncharacterized membrane protein
MKRIVLILTLLILTILQAVTYQEYNPNDDRFKVLALEKAKKRLTVSERDFDNAVKLYEKKMISQREYEDFKLQYENDKLNFQQYMLSVIFDKPHLSVESAIKSQLNDGTVVVDLTISNTSGGSFSLEDNMLEELGTSKINATTMYNIYISLKDQSGNIISQPYEYHIKELNLQDSKKITFELLKDVESVTVSANYGDKFTEKQIYLKRKTSEGKVNIMPDIFSQEIESGFTAIYRLNMEFFGEGRRRYQLSHKGLPKHFTCEFINTMNNAVVSSVVFSENNPEQSYILKVSVPEKIGDNLDLNQPLEFTVCLDYNGKQKGETQLELIPTGKASLKLAMNNMYFSAEQDENITIYPLKVTNDGLKKLNNLSFDIFLPPNWEYKLNPEKIEELLPGDEQKLSLEVIPAKDAMSGIYQLRLKAAAKAKSRTINTSEKEVKLELLTKRNPFLLFIIILAVIATITGVIYGLIKVSKN